MSTDYSLGIDLGTTFSAAAISTVDTVEVFALGGRTATIPSVVVVREHGEVLVGEAAERRALAEPTRSAREFKRRLGDPTPIFLGGVPYGAESLTAHLLRAVVEGVVERQGTPPSRIALTHPATYRDYKLDLMRLAVGQADVGEVSFVSEPEAAALYYAGQDRLEVDDVVAVYDFGGGTFDATVVRKSNDGFELIGTPEGMERIGGIDFDEALLVHVDEALGGALSTLDGDDPATRTALARLRDECRQAKEALSSDTDVSIPVALPNLNTEVRVTRAGFEALVRPRVTETIEALNRAVRSAGLDMDGVARVLLVGGTSHIPLVRQMVREATGRPVALDIHPKHSVSLGAAELVRPQPAAAETLAVPVAAVEPPAPPPPPAGRAATAIATAVPSVEPSTSPEPRRSRAKVLVPVVVLAAVLVAAAVLLTSGGGSKAASASSAAPPSPQPVAQTSPQNSGGATAGVSSTGVKFGDAEIAIGTPSVVGQSLTVPVRVHNNLKAKPLSLLGVRFRATLRDGHSISPGGTVDAAPLDPGASADVPLVFAVDQGVSVDGAVITIDAVGKEPVVVPLAGPVSSPLPRMLAANGQASFSTPGFTLTYALENAVLSFDREIEEGTQTESVADRRAASGSTFLALSLKVTSDACACPGGINWSGQQLHLMVDGVDIAPWTTASGVLQASSSVELKAGFVIPAGAHQAVLQVGDGGAGDPARQITIELPQ
jgi:actin-like ATPase involved in cell morphogenesis